MTPEEKIRETIEKRQKEDKAKLLEELAKVPIIQYACARAGIARATYYRWIQEDAAFGIDANRAIEEGVEVISDMGESQLIKMIREEKFQAIRYWLDHHKDKYRSAKYGEKAKQNITLVMDM